MHPVSLSRMRIVCLCFFFATGSGSFSAVSLLCRLIFVAESSGARVLCSRDRIVDALMVNACTRVYEYGVLNG